MFIEEKKVEFIELIYDLIFVYLIGRSNEILHEMEGDFFTAETYLLYLFSAAVILEIWYQSTLFINRYGKNSLTDYIGLFINMYLLYYMATAVRTDWDSYFVRYHVAWGLILVNLAVQYYIQLRKHICTTPLETSHVKSRMVLLLLQAATVFISIPLYLMTHFPLSWVPLIIGFAGAFFTRRIDTLIPVNFEHLTERVMLYIVVTFGEMIVGIAVYFEGAISFDTVYYSLFTFLIVTGLFLVYGFLYNHVIDRTIRTSGASKGFLTARELDRLAE